MLLGSLQTPRIEQLVLHSRNATFSRFLCYMLINVLMQWLETVYRRKKPHLPLAECSANPCQNEVQTPLSHFTVAFGD